MRKYNAFFRINKFNNGFIGVKNIIFQRDLKSQEKLSIGWPKKCILDSCFLENSLEEERWNHLRCHDTLPLRNQGAFSAHAVLPATVSFVTFESGDDAVIPTPRTFWSSLVSFRRSKEQSGMERIRGHGWRRSHSQGVAAHDFTVRLWFWRGHETPSSKICVTDYSKKWMEEKPDLQCC